MTSSSFCQTSQLIVGHMSSNRSKNLTLMFEPHLYSFTRPTAKDPGEEKRMKRDSFESQMLGCTGPAPAVRDDTPTTGASDRAMSSILAEIRLLCCSNHDWNISTPHICACQLRRPLTCSDHFCRMGSAKK